MDVVPRRNKVAGETGADEAARPGDEHTFATHRHLTLSVGQVFNLPYWTGRLKTCPTSSSFGDSLARQFRRPGREEVAVPGDCLSKRGVQLVVRLPRQHAACFHGRQILMLDLVLRLAA